jgi:CBS domain-containing protein
MVQSIREVMTADPRTIEADAPVAEAAQVMRDADVGSLVVVEGKDVCGIVTDRDIVVRAVADGRDLKQTHVADVCSRELTTLDPTDSVEDAVKLMRQKAVRRLPVLAENGRPVGIVALGDLAVERETDSTLGDISASRSNR